MQRVALRCGYGVVPHVWEVAASTVLPRHRGNKEADDGNLEISQTQGEANGILVRYRLPDAEPTLDDFCHEHQNSLSRTNFIPYFTGKVWER